MSRMIDMAATTIARQLTNLLAAAPPALIPYTPSSETIEQLVRATLMVTARDAAKADAFEMLIGDGTPVLVIFDGRIPGVSIPGHLERAPKVILRLGLNLNPPILELAVDAEQVSGVCTFDGKPFRCVVPWKAVYAIVSDAQGDPRTAVWSECIPPEVMNQENTTTPEAPPPAPVRHLKSVD